MFNLIQGKGIFPAWTGVPERQGPILVGGLPAVMTGAELPGGWCTRTIAAALCREDHDIQGITLNGLPRASRYTRKSLSRGRTFPARVPPPRPRAGGPPKPRGGAG